MIDERMRGVRVSNKKWGARMYLAWRRAPLKWVIACLILALALQVFEFPIWALESLRLYRVWPPAVLVAAVLPFAIGWSRHRNSGLPQFHPLSALVAAALMVGLTLVLVADTAADWEFWWAFGVVPLLLLGSFVMAVAMVCFTELWRLLFNDQIVKDFNNHLVEFTRKILRKLVGHDAEGRGR